MKDYKLSEIKEICKQNHMEDQCNGDCPFQGYCGRYFGYDIEPCDWELDTDWQSNTDENEGQPRKIIAV